MENADFRKFCELTIVPALGDFERRRRTILKLTLGAGGAWLVFVGLFAGLPTGSSRWGWLIPISGAAGLGLSVPAWWKWRLLLEDFKRGVMVQVVKFLGPDMNYLPETMVDQTFFTAGRLFQHRVDRYEGEDYVEGTLGQTDFQFSEIHAEYKSKDTKGRTTWYTIFRGIYFVADFNKHFQSTTVVLPDTAERALGFLGKALQSMNPNRDKLIRLEDPEFEREFVVYGEDQVEARYILTPALMQRMLALKRKFGTTVSFSFTGSAVHVAIATTHDHFEPRLFSTVSDPVHIESFLDDLRAITGIIEDMNLNTRIWTKV